MNDLNPESDRTVIAIVDDDLKVRNALRRLFRSAGFEVETFPSGEEFIPTLTLRQPHCLLLDFHMLGLTGMDVQRQLLAMGAKFPVILITGQNEPGLAEKAVATGVAAFLPKPLDGDQLLETVQNLVARATD